MTSFPLLSVLCKCDSQTDVLDSMGNWLMAMGDAVTMTELLKVQFPALRELQEPLHRGFSTCAS